MNYEAAWKELRYFIEYKIKMEHDFSVDDILIEMFRLEERFKA